MENKKKPVFLRMVSALLAALLWSGLACVPTAFAAAVEGVVLTEHGPLDGGKVLAFPSLRDTYAGKPAAVSTLGARLGFYRLELPPGTYYLVAEGRRGEEEFFSFHGANPVTVGAGDLWLPFTLTPMRRPVASAAEVSKLTGTVTYRGKPVADAQVSLYTPAEGVFKGMGLMTRTTGEDGSFSFVPPSGSYLVVARKRLAAKGDMRLRRGDLFCYYGGNPVAVEEGRATSIEVSCYPRDDLNAFLDEGVAVKRAKAEAARYREKRATEAPGPLEVLGTVRDRAGRPVRGLTVAAYKGDPSRLFQMHFVRTLPAAQAATDGQGRYRLGLSDGGSYYLVARELGGEAPVKGELYGLYEGNVDHAVTVGPGGATADIVVGRVMADEEAEAAGKEPAPTADRTPRDAVIDRDTVWEGEITVEGRVLVRRGATLTIRPGTVVKFRRVDRNGDGVGDGELRVLGRLVARGKPGAPIRFTSAEERPAAKDWSYVLLFGSGDGNVIERCVFEYAFTGLQVHFSRAVARDSVFARNHEGIRFGRAEMRIEHNDIFDNVHGIRHHRLEGPVAILNNVIRNNEVGIFLVPSGQNTFDFSPGAYAADSRYRMLPEVRRNDIYGNGSYNYRLGERQSSDVPLPDNWWGTPDAAAIRAGIFDHEQDPSLGRVVTSPHRQAPVPGAGRRKGGLDE